MISRLKPEGLGVVRKIIRPVLTLYAVEAWEVNPPAGQSPVHWRLMTTHATILCEQAWLGGWSADRSQRPPGMPTFVHGLQQFKAIFLGWKTALGGLVCTR